MHGQPLCALASKISRKGRKGYAKSAKRDALWLCVLCALCGKQSVAKAPGKCLKSFKNLFSSRIKYKYNQMTIRNLNPETQLQTENLKTENSNQHHKNS